MTTTVPPPTFTTAGLVLPAQADILDAVLNDLNTAFGGNLNIENLFTPQGQLASTIAALIADNNALYAYMVSQVDPAYSQGFMQDAIGRIFNQTRLPATSTVVTATCSGLPGTVIAPYAQALTEAGDVFVCVLGGSIGAGGVVSLPFTAYTPGAVECAVGALSRIGTATPGWDSIVNTTGTDTDTTLLGVPIEGALEYEIRRQNSLTANAVGVTSSIYGAVAGSGAGLTPANIPSAVYVRDNSTGAEETIGAFKLPASSVYIAVRGGDPASIAEAILAKKSLGASYAPSASFTASVAGTVLTVSAVDYGALAVNQTIMGAGVPSGTYISALGTGAGGTGTYALSASAGTIGSEAMTSATVISVQETSSGQAPPPVYSVAFTRPSDIPVKFAVSIVQSPAVPSNITAAVQAAITSAMTDSGSSVRSAIGSTVYAGDFYAAVQAISASMRISSILVGTTTANQTSVPIGIDQFPTVSSSDITVTMV